MTPFENADPLLGTMVLRNVVMRFYRDPAVPIIDEWGNCIGIVHREDCKEVLHHKIIIICTLQKCIIYPPMFHD